MGLGEMGLGEMGLGELGLGEMGLGEMGLGDMGHNRLCLTVGVNGLFLGSNIAQSAGRRPRRTSLLISSLALLHRLCHTFNTILQAAGTIW